MNKLNPLYGPENPPGEVAQQLIALDVQIVADDPPTLDLAAFYAQFAPNDRFLHVTRTIDDATRERIERHLLEHITRGHGDQALIYLLDDNGLHVWGADGQLPDAI